MFLFGSEFFLLAYFSSEWTFAGKSVWGLMGIPRDQSTLAPHNNLLNSVHFFQLYLLLNIIKIQIIDL